jgi:hypothetical protein
MEEFLKPAAVIICAWILSGFGRLFFAISNKVSGRSSLVPLDVHNGRYLKFILLSPVLPIIVSLFSSGITGAAIFFVIRWAWVVWVAFFDWSYWMLIPLPFVGFFWIAAASRNQ